MSESSNPTNAFQDQSVTRPRLWPAIVISAAQVVATVLFARLGATNIQNAIALGGIPAISLLLLLIWWLVASRVPMRDRLMGLALVAAGAAAIVFSQASAGMGGMLLARVLPVLTLGAVLLLVVTSPVRWPVRRWFPVGWLVLCVLGSLALRVDSIGGDLYPVISWRWEPTAAQRSGSLALLDRQETALLPDAPAPDDWPAFRGPNRDGRVEGVRFALENRLPFRELWRREIGSVWSAFIVVGEYLFTQEQRGDYELVTCYAAGTGAPVWQNRLEATFEDGMGLGPRATPAYASGYLYAQGGTGILQCLDAATGRTVWKQDLVEDAGARLPEFGFSASPLVVDDLVIVFTGGRDGEAVAAYDRLTGDRVWSAGHRGSGYCSPHLATLAGMPQVLMVSNFGIQSFAVDTGAPLWDNPWDIKTNPRCTQPSVIGDDRVMLGATGTSGTRLLRVTPEGDAWQAQEQWTTRQFRPYFNDGAMHKGHYYGFDGDRIACLDIEEGRRLWSGDRYSGQLLLLPDMDMLLILSEAGDIVFVPATPDGFSETARFNGLSGKTWNHPVIAHGRLYVRNAREAVCFELPIDAGN